MRWSKILLGAAAMSAAMLARPAAAQQMSCTDSTGKGACSAMQGKQGGMACMDSAGKGGCSMMKGQAGGMAGMGAMGGMACMDSGGGCPMMQRKHGGMHGGMPAMHGGMHGMMPMPSGSSVFDALSMEVAHLEADSATDWSKVDLEALRQHLIDMNLVMMDATVTQKAVDGGISMKITGTGRTVGAIQRMVADHMAALAKSGQYVTKTTTLPNGVTATVTAPAGASAAAVTKIRALGFAGLMTEGNHHMRHHGAMARGDSMPRAH